MPQIDIRAPSPPQIVEQDDIAIIELDPPANQDVSAIEQVEAIIQDEQPENQDNALARHPDIRQAGVVSRRDGPAAPYLSFSDEDSAEEDQDDVETVVHNDVANMEDVIKEDDLSASLEEVSYPLELAIEEIRSMSVTSPQIITID